MSGEEEFEGGYHQVPPEQFFAQLAEQQATVRMANEDFGNRWNDLMLSLDDEHIATLRDALAAIGNGEPISAIRLANYFEGQLRAAAFFRAAMAAQSGATNPQAHAFIPDDVDLDNPYCAARNQAGEVCGLPPANGRHQ